jgi:hypothetical protein
VRALPILEAVRRRDDANVLTMRSYSMRKLDQFDLCMALYARALVIAPDSVDIHEYLGEAHVLLARPELERAELATVRRLCGGAACEQYTELAEAIATGKPE